MSRIKIKGGSITVSIGRKSRNCAGLSICVIKQVTITVDEYTITWDNQNRASVKCNYETVDTKNFYLTFNQSIINDIVNIEGGYKLVFEESFVIDNNSASVMGVNQNFTIAQGEYPIVYNNTSKLYEVLLTDSN